MPWSLKNSRESSCTRPRKRTELAPSAEASVTPLSLTVIFGVVGAAAAVLEKFEVGRVAAFGDAFEFTVGSDGYDGMKRAYKSFAEAAKEAGKSRIYGGIHFECDNREGQKLGRAIAEEICRTRLLKDE